jgi:hypothetical protein
MTPVNLPSDDGLSFNRATALSQFTGPAQLGSETEASDVKPDHRL